MRRLIKGAVIPLFIVGYLVADCWLYLFSGLSNRDAMLLDVPFTLIFIFVAAGVYWLVAGDEAGYWPKPPRK
jgi:hypothetical protein